MTTSSAWYFDGRVAQGHPARVDVHAGDVVVTGLHEETFVRVPASSVVVGEKFERGPLMLTLPRGAVVQIDDPEGPSRTLDALRCQTIVHFLQSSWPAVIAAVAILVAAFVIFYLQGLPWIAERLAAAVPPSAEARAGSELLQLLDRKVLLPSSLDEDSKRRIETSFSQIAKVAAPGVDYRIEFRAARGGPAVNAFALPGGTIVVLDGLVNEMGANEMVFAVLGHELGHVALRHPLQRAVKTLGVGAMAGVLWGDISSVAVQVPAALGALRYSRAEEEQADDFAVAALERAGLTAEPMLQAFEILQGVDRRRGRSAPSFLLSHPAIGDRIERIRTRSDHR